MSDVAGSNDPIQALSAVTLLTAEMSASVDFYHRLGFVTVYGGAAEPFTTFRAGAGFLNLQLDPDRPKVVLWGRVIFWVDDVDAMYARALAARVMPETSPADAPWGERFFHLRDPDGHELSFARRLERPH